MKIFYKTKFPPKNYAAINLFGIIVARKECAPLSARTLNHEAIHTAQMKDMLYLFFYIWYGIEWLIRLLQYRNFNEAYRNISFEREAYRNDADYSYLSNRKFFSFSNYIFLP